MSKKLAAALGEIEWLKRRVAELESIGTCVHCGHTAPIAEEDREHWRSCPAHPARVEIERLEAIIKYAIKQTHYGGCHGGLSESEARTVHDALVLKLSGKDVNHE